MSAAIDYAAELERTRREQGLDLVVPQHLRAAVAALLSTADELEGDRRVAAG